MNEWKKNCSIEKQFSGLALWQNGWEMNDIQVKAEGVPVLVLLAGEIILTLEIS